MPAFETQRLSCRPLALSEYETFARGDEPQWLDFSNPYKHLVEGPSPLSFLIPRVLKDTSFADIGLILAIEKSSGILVGSAGFHDFPNDGGMIEIGFGIVPEKQGVGFGQELLLGMWKMITRDQRVKVLRYTVSPENAPSLHIINKLEFHHLGEQFDEEDGVELIYELDSKTFQNKFGGDERI